MSKNGTTTGFDDRVDQLKESVRGMVDFGGDRASALKERLGDVKDTVVSGGRSGINKVGSLIKDHPIAAIGIAFGIGYLAIRIARR